MKPMGYTHLNCLPPSPSSRASLVARLVKNRHAMNEIPVRFLSQEDSPGEGIGHPLQYSWTFLVAQTVKNLSAGFDDWIGKIPWRRARQPTPGFLPGESHGQRSLAGCSPWSCKELDTTEGVTRKILVGLSPQSRRLSQHSKMHAVWMCVC